MRIDIVVVNASPLITLFRSGQAGLLPQMFQKIIVPGAVWTEVTGGERDDPAARELIVHPQTEDYWGNVNPIGTRSCYDEGAHSATVEDIFRGGYTAVKTPTL